MSDLARLVVPALRWRSATGFEHETALIERTLALGVGGYILFGGERHAVHALVHRLQAASRRPLLIASDLERGAGQQFDGLTCLPPAGALGFIDDPTITGRCGAVTAAEALSVGVTWIYAPVADLDLEAANPIVQTRSFGDDPQWVARHVAAFIEGVQLTGAMACAKHYPGHGRTVTDSHETLPRVATPVEELRRSDLVPFHAAVRAGVRSVMTAHVAYDGWHAGCPATRSRRVLHTLRRETGFDGLVVTDALVMDGVLERGDEAEAASAAVAAGCDVLLHPNDPERVVERLTRDAADPARRSVLDAAVERVERDAARPAPEPATIDLADHVAFAAAASDLAIHMVRGVAPVLPRPFRISIADDDAGGPHPVDRRDAFEQSLRDAGLPPDASGSRLVLIFAEPMSWKGRARLGNRSLHRLREWAASTSLFVLFGHPRLVAQIPGEAPVVCAWHGHAEMQRAVGRWVLARWHAGA